MTRDKEKLYIMTPGIPSIFINEIVYKNTQNNNEYSPGQRVKHKKYGEGTIVDIVEKILSIKFEHANILKFDIDFIKEGNILTNI